MMGDGTQICKHSDSWRQLITENIDWLLKQPRTLERDHIEVMLREQLITPPSDTPAVATEAALATAINSLFKASDTVSIVSYESLDGSKTLYRIEDEIGDHLTDGYDTWQGALLAARTKAGG